jgi:hypothetical protein
VSFVPHTQFSCLKLGTGNLQRKPASPSNLRCRDCFHWHHPFSITLFSDEATAPVNHKDTLINTPRNQIGLRRSGSIAQALVPEGNFIIVLHGRHRSPAPPATSATR